MEFFSKDNELIKNLCGKDSLTSSSIKSICIYTDKEKALTIDLTIELAFEQILLLRFLNVVEYSFYHHDDYFFYNIEIVKFFCISGNFYISFDPVDEAKSISNNDQDFILCKHVDGYWIYRVSK